MSLLGLAKISELSERLEDYTIYLRGESKSGKTTFFAEFIKERYGDPECGLLIPFELGYKAIDGVNVFPYTLKPQVDIDGTPSQGWVVFEKLVDEIAEAKKSGDLKIKMICVDTVDEFLETAIEYVKFQHFLETHKKCKSLNDALGGYGKGKERLKYNIKNILHKLKDSGVGVMFLGHTKMREIKPKDGEPYVIHGSNLPEEYDNMIAYFFDIIGIISQEKIVQNKVLTAKNRTLRLRSNGEHKAGSRLKYIAEVIDFTPKAFIAAFEEAIMKEKQGVVESLEEDTPERIQSLKQRLGVLIQSFGKAEDQKALINEIKLQSISIEKLLYKKDCDNLELVMESFEHKGGDN